MAETPDFSSIRPYEDHEIHEVFKRLKNETTFLQLIQFLFPNYPTETMMGKLLGIKTIKEFQHEVIYPYVIELLKNTTEGYSCSGLDKLDPKSAYLFISNHRDIILDSAILNILIVENGFDTTEIAIGDNLLIYPWITDLVKLNRSFIVKRNIPVRQMMESSTLLSTYIRYTLTSQNRSIWIAQREGRSKDGDDRTQVSLLKMLNISGKGNFADNFRQLKIVPVSISYELDPCDYLKAYEFQQKRDNPNYAKTKADDLKHMGTGLRGRKGRVHFSFGTPIDSELEAIAQMDNKNDQHQALAECIDEQIHSTYKLWPGNFVACDCVCPGNDYSKHYTPAEKKAFLDYINEHALRLKDADFEFVYQALLEMYANPVKNFMK
ncbi:MAG: 1-acyl-sn-glycerol-3-phosphate acyltransferase [Breznakibacter sp.]